MGASGGEGLKAEGTQPGERREKRVIKNWKTLCNEKVTFMIFIKLFIKMCVERARKKVFISNRLLIYGSLIFLVL